MADATNISNATGTHDTGYTPWLHTMQATSSKKSNTRKKTKTTPIETTAEIDAQVEEGEDNQAPFDSDLPALDEARCTRPRSGRKVTAPKMLDI